MVAREDDGAACTGCLVEKGPENLNRVEIPAYVDLVRLGEMVVDGIHDRSDDPPLR